MSPPVTVINYLIRLLEEEKNSTATGKQISKERSPCLTKCNSEHTYQDGLFFVCPECAHEWSPEEATPESQESSGVIKDANRNVLQDGDTVTVIKDLKVKGSSTVVKVGTKVRNIRLVEGDHDIDCKIDGIGAMKLKSQYVKKI